MKLMFFINEVNQLVYIIAYLVRGLVLQAEENISIKTPIGQMSGCYLKMKTLINHDMGCSHHRNKQETVV